MSAFQKPQLSALVPSLLIVQEAFTKGQSCYCPEDDLYRECKERKTLLLSLVHRVKAEAPIISSTPALDTVGTRGPIDKGQDGVHPHPHDNMLSANWNRKKMLDNWRLNYSHCSKLLFKVSEN